MVWNTGSPQRIILGIYFLVAGVFGAVVEVIAEARAELTLSKEATRGAEKA